MGGFLAILVMTLALFLPKLLDWLERWSRDYVEKHDQKYDFETKSVQLLIHAVDTVSRRQVPFYVDCQFIKFLEV